MILKVQYLYVNKIVKKQLQLKYKDLQILKIINIMDKDMLFYTNKNIIELLQI
jgi:hypothetical protein